MGDIRYALRNLLRRPTFTLIAVVTLALGIGANTAIFSTVNALLLKPLPFPELDRIVAIWDKLPSRGVTHNEVTIVGVIKDVKHELNIPVEPEYYLPHAQDAWPGMVLVARTSVDPGSLSTALRQQVWAIDKDQPVFDVKTMYEVRSSSVALYSFSSVMLGIFAGVALALAAVGIYGVMAFAVTQRTQEIGVRMALGLTDEYVSDVRRPLFVLLCAVIAVLLISCANVANLLLAREVGPTDSLTFVLVSLLLAAVGLIACYVPARRATKVDPLVALRYE